MKAESRLAEAAPQMQRECAPDLTGRSGRDGSPQLNGELRRYLHAEIDRLRREKLAAESVVARVLFESGPKR
jgi:hypothetical protein